MTKIATKREYIRLKNKLKVSSIQGRVTLSGQLSRGKKYKIYFGEVYNTGALNLWTELFLKS